MNKIAVSKKIIPFIVYQRTAYVRNNLINTLLSEIGKLKIFYSSSVWLKSALFEKNISKEFIDDIKSEYANIKPYLAKSMKSMLDIGSGVGCIDIFISNHFQHKIKIYLLDKSATDRKIHYGFANQGSFYNSLELAKEFLTDNNVDPNNIYLQEWSDNKILFNSKYDLIVSFLSWGFHYPIRVYLNQVYDKLNDKGVLILDLRKNTEGFKQLKKKFGNIEVIYEHPKYQRIKCVKNL